MKKRFTDEQIISILREAESKAIATVDLCKRHNITEQTFCRWRNKFGDIYTTNAIESVNMSLRKLTKKRGSFPSDEALVKLFFLALRNVSKKWTMPVRDWKAALTRFTIQFGERISTN